MKRKVFTLRIEMDNAAFGDEPGLEIARILRIPEVRLSNDGSGPLYDSNGNRVGEWIIAEHPITKKGAR